MPDITHVCVTVSIQQCVRLSDLPLLGDLVRWGKLEKPLVFSGREFGRQHSNRAVRILPPGGHTLCNCVSLREGSTGEQDGDSRVCGEVTGYGKGKGIFADVIKNPNQLSIN